MTRSSVVPFQRFLHALFTLVFSLACVSFAAAQTETILHTFPTGSSDGFDTDSGLIADASGALYGVTHIGGACNLSSEGCGVAYKLTPLSGDGWSESVLHSFAGHPNDGTSPQGNLLFDSAARVFYGVTVSGGTNDSGIVFSLKPGNPWAETIIYNFPSGQNGQAGVVRHGGMLYGIAGGGSLGLGLVYRLRPPTTGTLWRQQILYQFTNGADGSFPQAAPTVDSAGNVYGTTLSGPGAIAGTVYKLSPPPGGGTGAWTYSNLYTFSGNADGNSPHSSVIFDSTGALYGTTETGGANNSGVVYKLTPPSGGSGPWTETVLYSFTLGTDGGIPWAGLIFDSAGNLYGATAAGGDLSCGNGGGCGVLFKLSPPSGSGAWTETVLYSFVGGAGGDQPFYTPLLLNGNLFGTTAAGGGSKNGGIAFEVTP